MWEEWHLTCACNTLTRAWPASICIVQAKGARHCDPMNGDEAQRLHSLASPQVHVGSQSYQDLHIRQTSALPHGGVLPPATSSSPSPARPGHRACGHSHPMPGCPDADPTTPVWEVQANAHVAAVAISETRRSVQRTWRLMSTPRLSLHPLGVSESCSEPVQERCGCACACAWVATSAA